MLYFGTPALAVPPLQALLGDDAITVVGVGTMPDRPIGRKQVLTPPPVAAAALAAGVPLFRVEAKRDLQEIYTETKPDVAVVIAFGVLFPEEVLGLPPLGTLNVHFSRLPEYRGASPVQAAILDGAYDSAITLQRMVKRLDAGPVLCAWDYDLRGQTTAEAWSGMSHMTAENLPVALLSLREGGLAPTPQDETAATYCGKYAKKDGEIFPQEMTKDEVLRQFRAFTPWPGVWVSTPKGPLKLLAISDEGIEITCADGAIFASRLQLPGKAAISAQDFAQGYSALAALLRGER